MPEKTRIVFRGKDRHTLLTESGKTLTPPDDWELLPPGDAAHTRAVKKAGPCWQIELKKGRRVFSGGIWAASGIINKTREELEEKRTTPGYLKRKEYDQKRRQKTQEGYVRAFYEKTLEFLAFHSKHETLALLLAGAVTEHATPVGSGTVARTQRIPLENRVKAAVIAWMRHNTTAYDHMKIKRIKGERRKVRRSLAETSETLLNKYRAGDVFEVETCPLYHSLKQVLPKHPGSCQELKNGLTIK